MRLWAQAQPHEHQYHPLSVDKVTVWGTLGRDSIIWPYWFEHADGHPGTVNTQRYIAMRRKFIPTLKRR